jgi:hypothetical protein
MDSRSPLFSEREPAFMKFATGLLTTSFVAAATALGATTITLYD